MPFAAAIPVMMGTVAASSWVGITLIASAALGTIGALTDNAKLMKLGAIAGLVGGIGALAGAGGATAAGEAAAAGAAESTGGSLAAEAAQELAAPAVTGTVTEGLGTTTADAALAGGAPPADVSSPGIISNNITPPPPTWMESIKANPMAYAIGSQVAGPAIAGAFDDTKEDQLRVLQEKQALDEAERRRRIANMNNIGLINLGLNPNLSANPYARRPYRPPAVT